MYEAASAPLALALRPTQNCSYLERGTELTGSSSASSALWSACVRITASCRPRPSQNALAVAHIIEPGSGASKEDERKYCVVVPGGRGGGGNGEAMGGGVGGCGGDGGSGGEVGEQTKPPPGLSQPASDQSQGLSLKLLTRTQSLLVRAPACWAGLPVAHAVNATSEPSNHLKPPSR